MLGVNWLPYDSAGGTGRVLCVNLRLCQWCVDTSPGVISTVLSGARHCMCGSHCEQLQNPLIHVGCTWLV